MDNFFYKTSKIIIFIPIVFIVLGLFIRFNEKENNVLSKKNKFNEIKIITSTPIKNFPNNENDIKKIKINLNENWICDFKINENENYRLEINKRKIYLEASISGKIKRYDFSPYASIIENYLNNFDINKIEQIGKLYFFGGFNFIEALKNCRKI